MCFRNQDKKRKTIVLTANMCLVIGLLLKMFFHPVTQFERNWGHGVSAALLIVYIGTMLWNIRQQRFLKN